MIETKRYFGEWSSYEDMRSGCGFTEESTNTTFPAASNVIAASYKAEGYEGYAFVIYRKADQLFETAMSHCSCNGLEWTDGTPISWEYVHRFMDHYNLSPAEREEFIALVSFEEFHKDFDAVLCN